MFCLFEMPEIAMEGDIEGTLLARASEGDSSAIGALLELHSARVKRMLQVRFPSRLGARLDVSDVWQEVQIDAARRLPEYLLKKEVDFFVWLRFLAHQKLDEVTRKNLGTQARDISREQGLAHSPHQSNSSIALANFLVASATTPSVQMQRIELHQIVQKAIDDLDDTDREILLMRHAEEMSTSEVAAELGIPTGTCRQRHLRALQRLRQALNQVSIDWSLHRG